jgi:hypothetical protein
VTEYVEPSVLDSARALLARSIGQHPGEPLTTVQAADGTVLLLGAGLVAVAVVAARRLTRRLVTAA